MINDLEEAGRVLDIESQAIQSLKSRLGAPFIQALDLLQACTGKVVITGMGKSGQIGRKIASTMASTGSPAMFLHPAESSHGDLGVVATNDVVFAISLGGETPELKDIVRYAVRKGIPLIACTGNLKSTLAQAAQVVLDISVNLEACPLGLAPTASSTVTLALGDALAMCLVKRKGFREEDFAEYHPGGSLGRRLLTRVEDVMHTGDAVALVNESTNMREVLALMTNKEVRGVAGVIESMPDALSSSAAASGSGSPSGRQIESGNLIGIITDGDIRRRLEKSRNPLEDLAGDIMSRNPKTVDASELAEKALFMMEQFGIQTLFVVRRSSGHPIRPIGLLHLQDLLRAKLR
jgi:arabinose-5-phosphate isomerase